ncbi:MAG: hypothetical protein OXF88_10480 [Rhodobacteraceae bacterium]|nr:hypothetical protein [Paracoccaceae bacterium]MCY4141588.1 hypothetical protein [Paracoccaceae bacterium]
MRFEIFWFSGDASGDPQDRICATVNAFGVWLAEQRYSPVSRRSRLGEKLT